MVLAFLGHDTLMTTDAHAAQMVTRHHAEHHRPEEHGSAVVHRDAAAPEHPPGPRDRIGACDVTRPVVRPAVSGADPSALAAVITASTAAEALPGPSAPSLWSEPTAPPGVRRALFQVYRI